MIKWAYSFCIY